MIGELKALTICQPYASMIVLPDDDDRAKRVENRTWGTEYRGPLLIHAGKSKDYLGTIDWIGTAQAGLPMGAIVGICELAGCVEIDTTGVYPLPPRWAHEKWPWLDAHEHLEGPIAWVLRECRAFPIPIPCKGSMGLWKPPPSVQDSVNAAMAAMSLARLAGRSTQCETSAK